MKSNVAAVPKTVLRGALALSALALALAATEARASTAANTQIVNTATVNYNDAGGNAQTPATGSVTVTVSLVPSAVTLSSPANQSIGQGTSATLAYTITSTANGPDTYNLASTDTLLNITGGTATPPANVVLGGTTLAAAANNGNLTITVPYDGTADGVVNGIAVGDTIVIGANAYVVAAAGITETPATNTSTITLTSAIAGGAVAAGSVVGERQTFNVVVTSGTVNAGFNSGTETVRTTATSATAPNPATAQTTDTVVTVTRPTMNVTKTVSIDGGASFVATANAVPGTNLVYKIVAHNSGASDALAVQFSDVVPAYLTYVAGQAKFATSAATTYAAATGLSDAADGDGFTFAAGTVTYIPAAPTSTVAAGGDLVLFFRATIN